MDADLNLQPPLNEEPPITNLNMEGQGDAVPDLNIDPESMVINSYEQQASKATLGNSDISVNQIMDNSVEPETVLAIEVPPVNFLHVEILPKELNAIEPHGQNLPEDHFHLPDLNLQGEQLGFNEEPLDHISMQVIPVAPIQAEAQDDQDIEADMQMVTFVPDQGEGQGDLDNGAGVALRVGLMLLLDNLEIDPGFEDVAKRHGMQSSYEKNVDGVRLWANHFSPLGQLQGIPIPKSWCDFFTFYLLNPSKFEWAKSLLDSGAWQVIHHDRADEDTTNFQIPSKCPNEISLSCPAKTECGSIESLLVPITPDKQSDPLHQSVSTSALHPKRKENKAPFGGNRS
jgi:hypothetical protein